MKRKKKMTDNEARAQVLEAGLDTMDVLTRIQISNNDHAILDRALEFLFLKAAGEDVIYDPND
jgi:hypothetical protein